LSLHLGDWSILGRINFQWIDPYTKEEYEKLQKIYLEYLENDPYEIYMRTMRLVFGKKS